MPTELEHAADAAFALMARVPSIFDTITGRELLPPGLALDMAQEHTGGDRDDAVTALLHAAARWLHAKRPEKDVAFGDSHADFMGEADALESCIRSEDLTLASSAQGTVHFRANDIAQNILAGVLSRSQVTRGTVSLCDDWRRWAIEAHRVIGLCRSIVAAAYPEASVPVPDDINGWQSSAE